MVNLHDLVVNDRFDEVSIFINSTFINGNSIVSNACRDAIQLGNERIVRLFLERGLHADSYASVKDCSALVYRLRYFAAKAGQLSILKLLVENGAKIRREHFRENDNQDALGAAIEEGHTAVVKYLLENGGCANGCFIGIGGDFNQTFLGRAASLGQKSIVDLLVKYGASIKETLSLNNENFRKSCEKFDYVIFRYSKSTTEKIEDLEQKKQKVLDARDALLQKHSSMVQLILDHAFGTNFFASGCKKFSFGKSCPLSFLKDLDVSEFNFVGVSIDGQPITREIILKSGFKGADKAIVAYNDISLIKNKERREDLSARLEAMFQLQGRIISSDGIVNLVPLADAAEMGFIDVVKMRLSVGIDPNQLTTQFYSIPAIVAAAQNGFFEVVKELAAFPKIDKTTFSTAVEEARKSGHTEIAEYLTSHV